MSALQKKENLGFAPEELDLTHLDQTQAAHVNPAVDAADHGQSQFVQPQHQLHPQQLTHLDVHGRAQMVDMGQVC